jgi:hypothetical protein
MNVKEAAYKVINRYAIPVFPDYKYLQTPLRDKTSIQTGNIAMWLHVFIIIAIGIMSFISTPANGATINVPADTITIQSGIDAASDGDIILIAPDIYNENLLLSGKTITLASWFYTTGQDEYIEQTVIDGGAMTVINALNVGDETKIIGLTIQNGDDGISTNSKLHILNNQIIGNVDGIDYEGGGGICSNNLFSNNVDDGIDLDGSTEAIITNNIIRDNHDDGIEIRLHAYSGPVLNIDIRDNLITGNGEDGIQLIDYPDLSDRVFRIERNLFVNNVMAAIGFMADGNTNEDFSGAGIPERVYIINNTFVGDNYGLVGGANVIALNNVFKDIQNSALRRVTADSIAAYSLFWSNGIDYEETNFDLGSTLFTDPLLDPSLHLTVNSPAIDAGTASYIWQGETVLDMPATSYTGSAPDMGAFESAYTDADGDGIPDDGDLSGIAGDNPCIGGDTMGCDDNCVSTPNPNQADIDNDGIGDVCDACTDIDGDGYAVEGGGCGEIDCNNNDLLINPGKNDTNCNNVDENCDGIADEGFLPIPTTCGVGACSANTGQIECQAGIEVDICDPFGGAAADDSVCNGLDDDCDTLIDEDYVTTSTSCGSGVCASTGQLTCQDGVELNTCTPGAPSSEVCDNLDNNCDGVIDDNLTRATSCGVGECGAAGIESCSGGAWSNDTCTPGAPSSEVCDNLDNNCDGVIDDNLTRTTSCGTGLCASTGVESCVNGAIEDTCTPGTPQTEGPSGDPTCSDSIAGTRLVLTQ